MTLGIGSGCSADKTYTDMNVLEFQDYISTDGVQLVDVRTAEEFAEGHLQGAVNIDVHDSDFISTSEQLLDKAKPVAVYCRSGKRSAHAAQELEERGYKVTNMEGGILEWEAEKLPISR